MNLVIDDDCLGCRARRTARFDHMLAEGKAELRVTRNNLALADMEVFLRHFPGMPRNLLVNAYRQLGWSGLFDVVDDPVAAAHALARAEAD